MLTASLSLTYVIPVILGLIIGSFLNVVIARVPYSKSLISPGSSCPNCKKKIRWWDNIPLISYGLLRGRCRNCKKGISIRYPVVEFLTALLFLTVRIRFGWNLALVFRDWPFVSLLLAITFIDLEHRIIPDSLSLGGLVLGLLTCGLVSEPNWIESFTGAVIGFTFFYSLAWIYYKWKKKSGLGGGDIKLLAMIGAFLGPQGVFATVFISSMFGSIVGISWALATHRKNVMKMAIPFGPFLVVGALCFYFLSEILWFRFMIPT